MLILLSPAKNMNFDPAPDAPRATKPALLSHTKELSETTRKLTRGKLKSLMGISENLADLNYERFQTLQANPKAPGAKQAALAFNGDVYIGLNANSLKPDHLAYAQDHLRILSGLYGLLRPLDAVEPYRLEMGSRLKNPRGNNLYEFWGDRISKEIVKSLKGHDDKAVVNLASNEYFNAVDKNALKEARIVTPVFKEIKDGKAKTLMFYAKRARGAMARWAIEKRIDAVEKLKKFNQDGYKFQPGDSTDDLWVFARPQPPKKS